MSLLLVDDGELSRDRRLSPSAATLSSAQPSTSNVKASASASPSTTPSSIGSSTMPSPDGQARGRVAKGPLALSGLAD